jgi:hypothetical protein
MHCRDLFGYLLRRVRKIAESSEEGSSKLIDLDSTSGLRRTSYLRIPAAKRNYVSKSFHMRKACRQVGSDYLCGSFFDLRYREGTLEMPVLSG